MKDIKQLPRNKYIWIGLALLTLTALLTNLGYSTLGFEEPRRAIVALEMMYTGEFIVPKINGYDYYNKAPVFNWLLILFFKVFQSSDEWVVRLPTVVSLLAICIINFVIVSRKIGQVAAFYSSAIFLTASNILFYFSFQGEIDIFYTLIVYVQIIAIFHFFQKENYAALFLISYLLTAVGVLTKGIPSLAFQAITILALFLYYKRFRALFSPWNFTGILLMVSVLSGYFYIYSLTHDPLPMITRLISESSKRTVVDKSWIDVIRQLYSYPLLLFTIMLPWSIMLFSVHWKVSWQKMMRNQWIRMCMLFVIFNSIVYWLSPGTRDRYLYMFVPFLALIMYELYSVSPRKLFSISILVFECLILAGSIGIPFFSDHLMLYQNLLIAGFILLYTGILIYLYFKYPEYRLFQFICFLLLSRIAFNFLVIPSRSYNRTDFDQVAEKIMFHQVDGLIAEETINSVYNPAVMKEVDIRLLDHPPYGLSYSYTKASGKVLSYKEFEVPGDTYLTAIENFKPGSKRLILDTVNGKKRTPGYIIYRVKSSGE